MIEVKVKDTAKKDIKKLDHKTVKKILLAIKELENYPDTTNIKKLKNFTPAFRKRVGDYRILFELENNAIYIYRIKHRKDAYD